MVSVPRHIARQLLRSRTRFWSDYQRLFLIGDISSWVIHWEMQALADHCSRLDVRTARQFWMPHARKQAIFYGSQFFLLGDDWLTLPHRIATAYFHGKPGTGYEEFDHLFSQLKRHHSRVDRLQVSHSEMEAVLLETGIAPEKLHRIPIGIASDFFPVQDEEARRQARETFGIPADAFVVGSFQKDGEGWDEGKTPKLIKGPDIFVETLGMLRSAIPNLHVLLSGPARGYVKQGLSQHGIPFTHHYLDHYPDIREMYHALDCYLVSSRQEGGPKAVLESMAAGIPLVSTRVGQAMDLVTDGVNGWCTAIEDCQALSERILYIAEHRDRLAGVLAAARATAEAYDYRRLDAHWANLFRGFVGPEGTR